MFRLLIVIGLLASLTIVVIQNLEPIALTLFGSKTPPLPTVAWVVSFAGAGFLTSLYLRALSQPKLKLSAPTPKRESPIRDRDIPAGQPPTPTRREMRATRQLEDKTTYSTPQDSPPANPPAAPVAREFDEKDEIFADDWDMEESPEEGETIARQHYELLKREKPASGPVFEVPQQPQTSSRQGTIYSYTYREKQSGPSGPHPVHDADYRVITPPYRENSNPPLDGEEETKEWI